MSARKLNDSESVTPGEISGPEILARLQDPSLTILNVLPLKLFEEGHIPGSFHLPVSEIKPRAISVLPDKRREIAVYCGGGH